MAFPFELVCSVGSVINRIGTAKKSRNMEKSFGENTDFGVQKEKKLLFTLI
jgi:hypothetical protein|tara:strand:+ start:339 stop:491 length:153 start_codon:yes stop_codon:yes gene_type:complete